MQSQTFAVLQTVPRAHQMERVAVQFVVLIQMQIYSLVHQPDTRELVKQPRMPIQIRMMRSIVQQEITPLAHVINVAMERSQIRQVVKTYFQSVV